MYDKPDVSVITMTSRLRRQRLLPRRATRAQDGDRGNRGDDGESDQAAPADHPLQPIPALAERVADEADDRRPDDRAGGVVEQERRPAEMARAGEHRAEDAQPGDEARDEHGLRPVTREEPVELIEPQTRQADAPAVPLDQTAAEAPAGEESEVVADNRTGSRQDDDARQRQPAVVRERRAGEQRRLARHRQPGVLEQHAEEDHSVAIAREEVDDPFGHDSCALPRARAFQRRVQADRS